MRCLYLLLCLGMAWKTLPAVVVTWGDASLVAEPVPTLVGTATVPSALPENAQLTFEYRLPCDAQGRVQREASRLVFYAPFLREGTGSLQKRQFLASLSETYGLGAFTMVVRHGGGGGTRYAYADCGIYPLVVEFRQALLKRFALPEHSPWVVMGESLGGNMALGMWADSSLDGLVGAIAIGATLWPEIAAPGKGPLLVAYTQGDDGLAQAVPTIQRLRNAGTETQVVLGTTDIHRRATATHHHTPHADLLRVCAQTAARYLGVLEASPGDESQPVLDQRTLATWQRESWAKELTPEALDVLFTPDNGKLSLLAKKQLPQLGRFAASGTGWTQVELGSLGALSSLGVVWVSDGLDWAERRDNILDLAGLGWRVSAAWCERQVGEKLGLAWPELAGNPQALLVCGNTWPSERAKAPGGLPWVLIARTSQRPQVLPVAKGAVWIHNHQARASTERLVAREYQDVLTSAAALQQQYVDALAAYLQAKTACAQAVAVHEQAVAAGDERAAKNAEWPLKNATTLRNRAFKDTERKLARWQQAQQRVRNLPFIEPSLRAVLQIPWQPAAAQWREALLFADLVLKGQEAPERSLLVPAGLLLVPEALPAEQ